MDRAQAASYAEELGHCPSKELRLLGIEVEWVNFLPKFSKVAIGPW